MRLLLASALALAACGAKHEPGAGSAGSAPPIVVAASPAGPVECTQLPFAESTPVPEASGAAWMMIDGKLALVVISDSGNDGAYAIVDPETGETREQGMLPLGGKDDDLEGVAIRGGKLVAVTSPGWILTWERKGNGFVLVDGPYPLGPIDLRDTGRSKPPEGDGMVCAAKHSNCGRNYEGLCLAPEPTTTHCVGFVAAKADGRLYCVVDKAGRLAVEHAGAIEIGRSGAIADCAFSDDGKLYVGSNFFDASQVYRVDGWQAPASAKVEKLAELGIGFPETLAARGDIIYRMSDTGGAPSLMARFRCAAP